MSQHLGFFLPQGLILINAQASLHLLGSKKMALQQNFIYTHLVAPFYNSWHTFLPSQCVTLKKSRVFFSWIIVFMTVLSVLMHGKQRFYQRWMSFNNNGPSKCHDLEHKRINGVDGLHNEPV